MKAKAPQELLCDMAEIYGVTDLKALPVETLAVLCNGLGTGSRTKMKLAGVNTPMNTLLLATIADRLGLILKALTGAKPDPAQKSIVEILTGESSIESSIEGFDTAEDFERERERILRSVK